MNSGKSGMRKAAEAGADEKKNIEYQGIFDVLEKGFQDAFVGELIPGIIHNFANPLNGIMGRSRLLQRKLMQIMKKLDAEKDASYVEDNQKLVNDVESINREADRLSGLLQFVTGKFCAISDRAVQKINLSHLIELEMKFFDFYLEFKHSIKKHVHLTRELPEVRGVPADYSLALSALIRYSMEAMRESDEKEFYISTEAGNGRVCIKIQHRGKPVSDDQKMLLLEEPQEAPASLEATGDCGLLYACRLLRKWGAQFEIHKELNLNTIAVWLPSLQR